MDVESTIQGLFDDYRRLRSRGLGTNFSPQKIENKLTLYVPLSCISLACFTRLYAPLPISHSIVNFEMLHSVRKALGLLLGVGVAQKNGWENMVVWTGNTHSWRRLQSLR